MTKVIHLRAGLLGEAYNTGKRTQRIFKELDKQDSAYYLPAVGDNLFHHGSATRVSSPILCSTRSCSRATQYNYALQLLR